MIAVFLAIIVGFVTGAWVLAGLGAVALIGGHMAVFLYLDSKRGA